MGRKESNQTNKTKLSKELLLVAELRYMATTQKAKAHRREKV